MRKLALAGFLIWLLATVALRLAGQWVIRTDSALSILGLLAVALVACVIPAVRAAATDPMMTLRAE